MYYWLIIWRWFWKLVTDPKLAAEGSWILLGILQLATLFDCCAFQQAMCKCAAADECRASVRTFSLSTSYIML